MSKINQIMKNSNYSLAIFSQEEIEILENKIVEKEDKNKKSYSVICLARNKSIQLKPEEVIRQLYLHQLTLLSGIEIVEEE
jgi:type I restriction enzyme M protein